MALPGWLDAVDIRITTWMVQHAVRLTRISLGIVFLWFGAIKLVPGWSPAEALATRTISELTFGLVPPTISLPVLAIWEMLIGVGLLSGRFLRATILLLGMQMAGTLTPLVLFPRETFVVVPFAPTLEGQYIIKNLVIISAAIVIGATVRGGQLLARPERP